MFKKPKYKKKPFNSLALIVCLIACLMLFIGLFIGFGLVQLKYIGPHEAQQTEFSPVSYTDYITILLSAISVILTILGMFIAIFSVFGFTFLKNLTVTESRKRSEEVLQDEMKEGGEIYELLNKNLQEDTAFREAVIEAIQRAYILPLDEVDPNDGNNDG